MGRKKKNKKKNERKTWEWSNRKINIGSGWTLLAVECFLRKTCRNCIYYRYCKQTCKGKRPVLRQVIVELTAKFGQPPQQLIDRACDIGYNDKH